LMHVEMGWGAQDTVPQGTSRLRIGVGGLELQRQAVPLFGAQWIRRQVDTDEQACGGQSHGSEKDTSIHRFSRLQVNRLARHNFTPSTLPPPCEKLTFSLFQAAYATSNMGPGNGGEWVPYQDASARA